MYSQRGLAAILGTNHTKLQRLAKRYPKAAPSIVEGSKTYYSDAQIAIVAGYMHDRRKRKEPPMDDLFAGFYGETEKETNSQPVAMGEAKPVELKLIKPKSTLPKFQQNGRVKRAMVPADKLSQKIFTLNEEQFSVLMDGDNLECVEGTKKGKKIKTPFWLKNAEGYLDKSPLTPFQREFLFMLISAYEAGYRVATYQSTLNALTGGNKSRLHANQYEAMRSAADKLRLTCLTIDSASLRGAFPKYNKENISVTISDYLLPCRIIEAEYNGQKTLIIEMYGESPLVTYARLKNQTQCYELNGLDVPRQNNTPLVMVIKNYLRRWTDSVINRGLNSTLTKETFCTNCGLIGATKRQWQEVRKIIEATLNHFVAEKIIASWHWTKNGNAYKGITIRLNA